MRLMFLCGLALAAFPLRAAEAKPAATLGGRVGWARLVTPSRNWDVHSDHDPAVADFIRTKTTLNMDPTCYPADPTKLDQLCLYPLIFTNDLRAVSDKRQLDNVCEYLKRGGFLYIDACANSSITGDVHVFLQEHKKLLARLIPRSEVRPLPADHPIYRSYFPIDQTVLFGPDAGKQANPAYLYGVYDGDRIVGIISFSTLLCGWPQRPKRIPESLRMIVNLYVYAMSL